MSSNSRTLELVSKDTVASHNQKNDAWVVVQGRKVVDISAYIRERPEKEELLLSLAGKDITDRSHEFPGLNADDHLVGYLATDLEEKELLSNKDHKVEVKLEGGETFDSSTFVKDLPTEDKLSIATDTKRDYQKHHFLDLEKPLIPQVLFGSFTKDFYVDQIHRPRHYGKGSAPLFGNFLEPISKTAWYVVPIVWGPVVLYFLGRSLKGIHPIFALMLFALGGFVWTLIEYCMHRFLFHFDDWLPENNVAFTIHFLLHGVHHYLPMDGYRLVVPPALFVVLCTPFYKLVFKLLPHYVACAGFAGGMFGYICYDLIHYFLHHSKMPKFMRKLKQYHLEHHYKNYQLGFGVSNWFWDKVFDTYLGKDAPISPMKYD
ncbi:fatty acid alpha-hydroxylase KNAG_0J00320 [Huiozyma naganishii CBS 8797]|uniref:Ceramide very long chain fatty acid hydroxylase n=1 Tax=Huiozyma naganishii (strain ATCC MYA-139 / BCRC 22969 / CBS 8797 / KCTC 17520 / NBRC 10181 / NCYC 3082 / Yp74L-3) TaxID=1071383 RepID=J7RB59_HUIN7|nr:hypothetical protein KNAG_0J00320 [Kazachstania naganishii CBS 8797]CCK72115.1 hypothetical protein KNAG_0J00320 [Kazachstania naganishii CBS 8797]